MINQRISPLQIGQSRLSDFGDKFNQSALTSRFQKEAIKAPVFSDPRFPGFSKSEVDWLEDITKDLPYGEKLKEQQNAYAQIIERKEYKREQEKRMAFKNSLYQDAINEKDKSKKKTKLGEYKIAVFADLVREREYEKRGEAILENDIEILEIEMGALGNKKLFEDFLNNRNNDLLYELGFMERPEVKEKSFGDKAKDSIVGPYVRAISGLIGAPAGAIRGLVGAVKDENGHMKDFFQQVMEDDTSNVQKALEFTFGGLARVVGGTVGGTIGGALEGLFKGSTTEEERDDLLGKLGTAVQLLAESETGEAVMDFWENSLNDAEKRGFGSLLEWLNVVGVDALFTKAGKQAMKEIGKYAVKTTETLGDIGAGGAKAVIGATEKATTAVKTYADDLVKMAGREAPSAKRVAKISKKADELVEKIVKHKKADTEFIKKGLVEVDTKGVKTFGELGDKLQETVDITEVAKRKILKKSKIKYTPTKNSIVESTVAGEKVSQNFIEKALNGLEELAIKGEDGALKATIDATRNTYLSEGLSQVDVDYLSAIWGKLKLGFLDNGQPSTSISKIGYENIRKGLKETIRKDAPDIVKQFDLDISNMIKAKKAVDKATQGVIDFQRTIKEENILQKFIGRGLDAANYASFGGLKTLTTRLGNKGILRLNPLDIQKKLPKYLKQLKKIENQIKSIPIDNKTEGRKAVDSLKLLQESMEKNLIKAQSTTKPTKVATSWKELMSNKI